MIINVTIIEIIIIITFGLFSHVKSQRLQKRQSASTRSSSLPPPTLPIPITLPNSYPVNDSFFETPFQFTHRAIKRGAVLQDLSFLHVLQLKAPAPQVNNFYSGFCVCIHSLTIRSEAYRMHAATPSHAGTAHVCDRHPVASSLDPLASTDASQPTPAMVASDESIYLGLADGW